MITLGDCSNWVRGRKTGGGGVWRARLRGKPTLYCDDLGKRGGGPINSGKRRSGRVSLQRPNW